LVCIQLDHPLSGLCLFIYLLFLLKKNTSLIQGILVEESRILVIFYKLYFGREKCDIEVSVSKIMKSGLRLITYIILTKQQE